MTASAKFTLHFDALDINAQPIHVGIPAESNNTKFDMMIRCKIDKNPEFDLVTLQLPELRFATSAPCYFQGSDTLPEQIQLPINDIVRTELPTTVDGRPIFLIFTIDQNVCRITGPDDTLLEGGSYTIHPKRYNYITNRV